MALNVEAAELLEHFQWLTQEESDNLNGEALEKVREEIGDVLIYLLMICDRLGLDPVASARDKVAINRSKYPELMVRGKALKYTAYEGGDDGSGQG